MEKRGEDIKRIEKRGEEIKRIEKRGEENRERGEIQDKRR